jgi:hypothetical protein
VPEEDRGSKINQQRRRLTYFLARWRARLQRYGRRINERLNRIRPQAGRISRLRTKVDAHDFD